MADAAVADPAVQGEDAGKKKKKSSRKPMVYGTYLHEIVKKKAPDHKISAKSMYILNAMVEDLQGRLRDESVKIAKFHKKSTLSETHVKTATKILFTGEICGNAVSEGTAACAKYNTKADEDK